MRHLLLIRHAKSSWRYPELADHDRPLNKRGLRDVPLMTDRLYHNRESIEAVFSSSAVRALAIAESVAQALAVPLNSDYALYTFSVDELLTQLKALPENYSNVAVVGHNPAITDVVNHLTGDSIDNVPTTGMVSLSCDIKQWCELSADCCVVDDFDYPKRYR